MIDLNLLYTFATNNKPDKRVLVSDYLKAQAFTKEKKQDWSRFFEALFSDRLTRCVNSDDGKSKLEAIDIFALSLNALGFELDDFINSLSKSIPTENNAVDKYFYKLIPDSRIFSSLNEIRKRGNIAFFPTATRSKNENNLTRISNTNFLFKDVVRSSKPNAMIVEKALLNMMHTPTIDLPSARGKLEKAELYVLLSCFFLNKENELMFEVMPKVLKDNVKSTNEFFELLGVKTPRELCRKRDEFYENILCEDTFGGGISWESDDNIIDGLVRITAGDDEIYDFDLTDATTIPVGQVMELEHNNMISKITEIKNKIDSELGHDETLDLQEEEQSLKLVKPFRITKQQCDEFRSSIIGQNNAVDSIIDKLTSVACGFVTPEKPIATMLLNGPTGVGKTQTAKAISNVFFDSKMYTVDMSTFKNEADLTRLTGSSPGYIGYDDRNAFIDFCMDNPRSVLLFDEIDKCAPSCLSFLLRVLDEGKFTTSKGEVVDLSKAVVIATTNQQVSIDQNSANHNLNEMTSRSGEVGSPFVKELLGRFDSLLEYSELTGEDIKEILKQKLVIKKQNFEEQNGGKLTVDWTNNLLNEIVNDSRTKATGARSLNSGIDRIFVRPISKYVVEKGMPEKGHIVVDGSEKIYVNGKEILVENNVKNNETSVKNKHSEELVYYH